MPVSVGHLGGAEASFPRRPTPCSSTPNTESSSPPWWMDLWARHSFSGRRGFMAKKNIYPVDWEYQLPERVLSSLDEYHILRVPLLGQHYENGPWDWCGRTSCS